ncbi:disulfide bond formation protein B [Oceaniglobus roseus]|uniref:disulfide bond formation protein B n=1 Tax=Oceaniglobus roseus TaxID=1737570 RepID=UPI000C7EA30A|nr:disulfide bond formation protein B [Kandeliimicrobium roseum]
MSRRFLILVAASGSLLLLLGAFVFQILGYAPCKLCIWQRWPHGLAIAMGGVGFFWPARLVAVIGGLAALLTSGIGVYHAGIEWKFWPGPTSCTGSGGGIGGLSGADLLDTSAGNFVVMCDQAAWTLMGISMAGWNALFSFLLALIWLKAVRRG